MKNSQNFSNFPITRESLGDCILGVEVYYVEEMKNFPFLHDTAKQHRLVL